jgi:alkylation response protein AidB-like acyl-CoA dehydrogenase
MDFNLSPANKMVVKTAKDFCERELPKIEEDMARLDDYPDDLVEKFAKAKLLGMTIPKEYGGLGSTNLNCILVCEQFGRTGATAFLPFIMNNSVPESIYHFGTEEQRKKFIPPLVSGKMWATTAFTEPASGSDPRMLQTVAVTDGDYYVVNGTKRFISMAKKPGYGIFYCKDQALEGQPKNCTALLIDKSSPGMTFSKHYEFMGLEGADTCDVFLKDVRVPKENVLGTPGDGFKILLRWIAGERIQQAAGMVGGGQEALELSIKYAKERIVNGAPLAFQQGFYWMIAEMKAKIDACRAFVYQTVCGQDAKERFETTSAELKIFVMPTMMEVGQMALQIHGSYGYSKEYKVEKLFRQAVSGGLVASSTEINKTIVGLSVIMAKQ